MNQEEKAAALARIRKLNSSALVIPATHGKVDPSQLLGIKAFVFDRIAAVEKEEEGKKKRARVLSDILRLILKNANFHTTFKF